MQDELSFRDLPYNIVFKCTQNFAKRVDLMLSVLNTIKKEVILQFTQIIHGVQMCPGADL